MKISIEQFDGGIQSDKRARTVGGCAMSRHFDHTVAPNKLVPRWDYEKFSDLDGVTDGIEARTVTGMGGYENNYVYQGGGSGDLVSDVIFLIGKKASGTGCAVFFTKFDGSMTGWKTAYGYDSEATPTSYKLETSTNDPEYGPLVCNATSDKCYFPTTGSIVTGDVGALDSNYPTTLVDDDGVVDVEGEHWDFVLGADRQTYITRWVTTSTSSATGNCLDALDISGNYTEDQFCVQAYTNISNVVRNGDYLGVVCYDRIRQMSELQIWDMVNDDPMAVLDIGPGRSYWADSLNGDWLTITAEYAVWDIDLSDNRHRLVLRKSNGGPLQEVTSLDGYGVNNSVTSQYRPIPITHKRMDEFLFYWRHPLDATPSTWEEGLWSVRLASTGEYALTLAYDTSDLGMVKSWYGFGDKLYFIHGTSNSVSRLSKTAAFTKTASFETLYNPQMATDHYFKEKVLEKIRIQTEPLSSGAQVTVKYRKDSETGWTTICVFADDSEISYEAVNIESTGGVLPDFKEIQFRLESTGGAVITGFEYVYETKSDLIDG